MIGMEERPLFEVSENISGKDLKYLRIASSLARNSTCSRRQFGAIIVKDDRIVGTGYNGSARGSINCGRDIPCLKELANEPSNVSYVWCPAVHAEQNAIINSNPSDMVGSTLYVAPKDAKRGGMPCRYCIRFILNAQIARVVTIDEDGYPTELLRKDLLEMDSNDIMRMYEELSKDE